MTMIEGIERLLFERDADDNETEEQEEEEEKEPVIETHRESKSYDVYETTLHYNNGDTETIETYGEHKRSEEGIKFTMDLKVKAKRRTYGGIYFDADKDNKFYSYQYLSREPELFKKGEETYECTYETEDGRIIHNTWNVESYRNIGEIE